MPGCHRVKFGCRQNWLKIEICDPQATCSKVLYSVSVTNSIPHPSSFVRLRGRVFIWAVLGTDLLNAYQVSDLVAGELVGAIRDVGHVCLQRLQGAGLLPLQVGLAQFDHVFIVDLWVRVSLKP